MAWGIRAGAHHAWFSLLGRSRGNITRSSSRAESGLLPPPGWKLHRDSHLTDCVQGELQLLCRHSASHREFRFLQEHLPESCQSRSQRKWCFHCSATSGKLNLDVGFLSNEHIKSEACSKHQEPQVSQLSQVEFHGKPYFFIWATKIWVNPVNMMT